MRRMLKDRELTCEGPSPRPPRRAGRSVTVNLAESPLTWLHARGHLSDRQLDAGERLRRDWEDAQLAPAVTMRCRRPSSGVPSFVSASAHCGRPSAMSRLGSWTS